jgi:hypothetical protein
MAFANVSGGSIAAGKTVRHRFSWQGDPDMGAQFFMAYPPSGQNRIAVLITFDVGMSRTERDGMKYCATVRNEGPDLSNLNFTGGGFV